jgi:hypothetical protein
VVEVAGVIVEGLEVVASLVVMLVSDVVLLVGVFASSAILIIFGKSPDLVSNSMGLEVSLLFVRPKKTDSDWLTMDWIKRARLRLSKMTYPSSG